MPHLRRYKVSVVKEHRMEVSGVCPMWPVKNKHYDVQVQWWQLHMTLGCVFCKWFFQKNYSWTATGGMKILFFQPGQGFILSNVSFTNSILQVAEVGTYWYVKKNYIFSMDLC